MSLITKCPSEGESINELGHYIRRHSQDCAELRGEQEKLFRYARGLILDRVFSQLLSRRVKILDEAISNVERDLNAGIDDHDMVHWIVSVAGGTLIREFANARERSGYNKTRPKASPSPRTT